MKYFAFLLLIIFTCTITFAQPKNLIVNVNQSLGNVEPTMWGVFFEDINLGADGGIYAEMIKNRSFEFFKPLMGWKVDQKPFVEGAVTIQNRDGDDLPNPRYMRIQLNNATQSSLTITNEGFRGMGIKNGLRYDFSTMYRTTSPGIKLHIELLDSKNTVIGSTIKQVAPTANEWSKLATSFTATETEIKGQFRFWLEGTGILDMDMISLFPSDTWKNRPGGLRADMVQMLADMKPGFIRFPGGCVVEGFNLNNRYQWKKTIGPVDEREVMINRWNIEFAHRPTPDYYQTFGLGFFEYFQLAEDIGAQPLPILNCGMACQFNSAELASINDVQQYVQDALDLIEFANGDTNTVWGNKRAHMGHPAPFNLKLLGIGNENWGPQYIDRLKIFQKAINEKYPYVKLITSSGTDPEGARFDLLNTALRGMNVDYIDEHYYRRPDWFFKNAKRYDSYTRTGSKIFAGEYAAQSDRTVSVNNNNSWITAISEAAFMTGLERNAAVVHMASYAPLFAHTDGWQWTPDLIWVNNLQVYGTPDYYVQKLFSLNKGTSVVPISLNNDVVAGQDSLYASTVMDKATNELIVKIVNASAKEQNITLTIDGAKKLGKNAICYLMQSANLNHINSFEAPVSLAPQQFKMEIKGKKVPYAAPTYSFTVLRIKM